MWVAVQSGGTCAAEIRFEYFRRVSYFAPAQAEGDHAVRHVLDCYARCIVGIELVRCRVAYVAYDIEDPGDLHTEVVMSALSAPRKASQVRAIGDALMVMKGRAESYFGVASILPGHFRAELVSD